MAKTRKNAQNKKPNQKGGSFLGFFPSENEKLSEAVNKAQKKVDDISKKIESINAEIKKLNGDLTPKQDELTAANTELESAKTALNEFNKSAPQVNPNAPKPSMFSGITSGVSSLWPFGKTTGGKSRRKQRRSRK